MKKDSKQQVFSLNDVPQERIVPSSGPLESEILFVGEAPGAEEEKFGQPFVGDTGQKFNYFLRKAGLDRNALRVANAIKFQIGSSKQKKIVGQYIEACRPDLVNDIKKMKNLKVIVPMGAIAINSILGKRIITPYRGYWYWSKEFNCKVFPTLHPASSLRNVDEDLIFERDFAKLVREYNEPFKEARFDPGSYVVCTTIKDVLEAFKYLKASKGFSFDFEVGGPKDIALNWMKGNVICGSFSAERKCALVIPFLGLAESETWNPSEKRKLLEGFKDVMESNVPKAGQNIGFDIKFCYRLGIGVNNVAFDTMWAHHLVNVDLPHNLPFLVNWYNLGLGYYDEEKEEHLAKKNDFAYIPLNVLYHYAGADSDAVYRLIPLLTNELKSKGLWELFNNTTIPLGLAMIELEKRGVRLSTERIDKASLEYSQRIEKASSTIFKLAGYEFNINSHKALGKLLFEDLGLTTGKKTKTGKFSTDADTLETLKGKHKVADALLDYRHLTKMKGTYLDGSDGKGGMKAQLVNERLHSSFNICGTRTGRIASSKPDLQNIPREKLFRNLFAAQEGWDIIEIDYEQMELRMLAFLSEDPLLLESIWSGEDIHKKTAASVYNIPAEQITKEQREIAKGVVHGLNYGRGEYTIEQEFGQPGKNFARKYFLIYKGVAKWREATSEKGIERGWLRNLSGRIRTFVGAEWLSSSEFDNTSSASHYYAKKRLSDLERQTCHYPVSGSSTDIISRATAKIINRLKDLRTKAGIVMTVHDALVFDCPKEETRTVMKIAKEEMETELDKDNGRLKIMLPVGIGLGPSWGEVEDISLNNYPELKNTSFKTEKFFSEKIDT